MKNIVRILKNKLLLKSILLQSTIKIKKISLGKNTIIYTNPQSLYIEYKDIFINEIYGFDTKNTAPNIIDGGSCIGVSVMYFKNKYPESKIICFEPDEEVFNVLSRNVEDNKLSNVKLVNAALTKTTGTANFEADGSDGGKIVNNNIHSNTIKTVTLSNYISEPVDLLKLNIEGYELPVLEELEESDKLRFVSKIIIEYHGWHNTKQILDKLLELLTRNRFRYTIHDFDAETNSITKPPFHYDGKTTWFCLVYATKME